MTRVGDRVRLEYTDDEYTNLVPGDEGTVSFIDGTGTCHVDWDNGSRLGLVPEVDRWTVLTDHFPTEPT